MEKQTEVLENNFINPQAIIDSLEIREGMVIGDFGCGTGYFTFPLAQKVGQTGLVYALDILKDKLEVVESGAKALGLNNIVVKRVNLEKVGGSKLADASLDWIFLINMLFQNKNREVIIKEAERVLKTGGKILVVEWSDKDASFGPANDLRVTPDEILALVDQYNLSVLSELKISDFHFGLVLGK